MSGRRISRHWHVGVAMHEGRDTYATLEHEHYINRDRRHAHRQGDNVYTSLDYTSEPVPEQLRDGPVRRLPSLRR